MSAQKASRRHLLKSLWLSLLILTGMGGVALLQVSQLQNLKNQAKVSSPEQLARSLEAEKLRLDLLEKIPAFGFDNLLADWVFLNFIQYFGDTDARKQTNYQLGLDYFDVIVDRDPRFRQIYLLLSVTGSIYAAMPERSIALMEKGLATLSKKILPRTHYIWRYKAIDELLFLGDTAAAIQSFKKAAEWASIFADEDSQRTAESSRETVKFLESKPDTQCTQITGWTMALQSAPDDRTRNIATYNIRQRGGKFIQTPEGGFSVKLPEQCL